MNVNEIHLVLIFFCSFKQKWLFNNRLIDMWVSYCVLRTRVFSIVSPDSIVINDCHHTHAHTPSRITCWKFFLCYEFPDFHLQKIPTYCIIHKFETIFYMCGICHASVYLCCMCVCMYSCCSVLYYTTFYMNLVITRSNLIWSRINEWPTLSQYDILCDG